VGDAVIVKRKDGVKITERGAVIQKVIPAEPPKDGKPGRPERYLLKFEARHWSDAQPELEVDATDPGLAHKFPEHTPRPFTPPKIPSGGDQ
jgi:hypothetical protein